MRTFAWILAVLVVAFSLSCETRNLPVGGPPVLTAVMPLTAVAAASVTFTLTNTGGAATSWAWDFGGCATPDTSTSVAPVVVAGSVGSYSCSVTATNDAGSDTFDFTFTVTTSGGGGGSSLGTQGGTITLDNITLTAPARILVGDVNFTHTTAAVPGTPPPDFAAIGQADVITADHPERLDAPLILTFTYSDTGIGDESTVCMLQYTPATGYQAVTVLSLDTTANTITIDARDLATFVIGTTGHSASAVTSAATFDTGFVSNSNGWQINNFNTYFAPSGNCLGMSAYAAWFYHAHPSEALFGKYSDSGAPNSVCRLLITRAHLAQSQYWAMQDFDYQRTLTTTTVGNMMKSYLQMTNQPLILILAGTGSNAHAGVLSGWDADGFNFYDVDYSGQQQHVSWSVANGFGTYQGFTKFAFVAQPSLGRTEDFEALTQEAMGGFTTSSVLAVTTPTPDEHVTGHSTPLEGTISGTVNPDMQVLAYVKGIPQTTTVSLDTFKATLPIDSGDNSVVLVAGVDLDAQSNFYLNAATLLFNVIGDAAKSELLATLTWDQDGTDVDLYCTEPAPSGETAWYANHETSNQLFLDFDNIVGFGPEHITLSTEAGGTMLSGNYIIRVHYFSDHETGLSASGQVSVVIFQGLPDQKMVTVPYFIAGSNKANDAPGSTGADWVDIATVDLIHRTIHVP